jgi:hypothetical protein
MPAQHALTLAQSTPPDPDTKLSEHMGAIVVICVGLILVAVVVDKLRKKNK